MASIWDAAITTPYGQVPGYPLNNGFHTGIDYGAGMGTPVTVNGQTIGLSGNTGASTGPHTHVGRYVNGSVTNPGVKGGMTLKSPVTVTTVGQDTTNGKYIRLTDGDGVQWVYLHLSRQDVKQGQTLQGGEEVFTQDNYDKIKFIFTDFGVTPPPNGLVVGTPVSSALSQLRNTPEWNTVVQKAKVDKKNLGILNDMIFGTYPKPPEGVLLGTFWDGAIPYIPSLPEYKALPPRGGGKYKPYNGQALFVEDK